MSQEQQHKHAWSVRPLEDILVRYAVVPEYTQDASQATQTGAGEATFLVLSVFTISGSIFFGQDVIRIHFFSFTLALFS